MNKANIDLGLITISSSHPSLRSRRNNNRLSGASNLEVEVKRTTKAQIIRVTNITRMMTISN